VWWRFQATTRRNRTRRVSLGSGAAARSCSRERSAQSTEAFLEETLRAVCRSMALAQYRPTRSFWGDTLWQEDAVPDYTPSKPVEPRLAELVR
jgi:hypothetical protein